MSDSGPATLARFTSLARSRILANSAAEVAMRQIAARSPRIKSLVIGTARGKHLDESALAESPAELLGCLSQLGVRPGSTLLIHSSDDAISALGWSPSALNDSLIDYLGSEGTLVLPTFPRQPAARPRAHRTPGDVIDYDVRRSVPWTGILGFDLMRRPGSIRSRFPINSLTAHGRDARAMFSNELRSEGETACGEASAWLFMAKRGARIVMIGVDTAHSLTINHVAEDAFEDAWPIDNWYQERRVMVRDGREILTTTVRERRQEWANYYAEGRLNHDLLKSGIVRTARLGSVSIAALDAAEHLQFLFKQRRRKPTYPYAYVPRRLWKAR